jgi:tRNA (Thr-GGU) A37 N-methylase
MAQSQHRDDFIAVVDKEIVVKQQVLQEMMRKLESMHDIVIIYSLDKEKFERPRVRK